MEKIPVRSYSTRELVAILEADGWEYQSTRGDHMYFKHPFKPGKLTVQKNKKNLRLDDVRDTLKLAGLR